MSLHAPEVQQDPGVTAKLNVFAILTIQCAIGRPKVIRAVENGRPLPCRSAALIHRGHITSATLSTLHAADAPVREGGHPPAGLSG